MLVLHMPTASIIATSACDAITSLLNSDINNNDDNNNNNYYYYYYCTYLIASLGGQPG